MRSDSKLILVVDDDPNVRKALAAALESSAYEVLQAVDGNAAIALSRAHRIALLITDLVMPEKEGIETIQQYVKEFPHIPIIAISGNPEYLPLAKVLGAARVLTKPIRYEDLLRAVRGLIQPGPDS